jgi:Sec-independent protein translocase protein TatA
MRPEYFRQSPVHFLLIVVVVIVLFGGLRFIKK